MSANKARATASKNAHASRRSSSTEEAVLAPFVSTETIKQKTGRISFIHDRKTITIQL